MAPPAPAVAVERAEAVFEARDPRRRGSAHARNLSALPTAGSRAVLGVLEGRSEEKGKGTPTPVKGARGDAAKRSPAKQKATASTRATGKRRQAKSDSR